MQALAYVQAELDANVTDPHTIYCRVRNKLWFMPAEEIRAAMAAAGINDFDGLVDPRFTTLSDSRRNHGFARQ